MRAALKPLWQRWLARRIPPAASVRLNQRRIFILPSRVGGAFAVALLLMLLVGINYQNSLAYGLTFLLMAVFVVTILHTYRNLAGLVLKAGGGAAVFVGEQACFRVRLESREREHQAIALGWPPAELMLRDVPRQGQTEVDLSQPAVRRGWLRPERLRVESRFPLGLLVAWSWVDLDQAVLVYRGRWRVSCRCRRAWTTRRKRACVRAARVPMISRGCASISLAIRNGAWTGKPIHVDRACWSRISPCSAGVTCGWISTAWEATVKRAFRCSVIGCCSYHSVSRPSVCNCRGR
ncbi:Uncharacterized conserved protein (some members contain a von Willebrand factor type A (vWA) domain) [Ectopseudomonas oleovorans]|uniref:Uncharacterized conserved protein (Some members contain a von Willebrand factor type A (VWA) domain) n=1 Tax=Ectopseudomonas oleovorans TaxID=301 RepID=A0A379PKJ2_ECTOL|nr:Uncharacterized conserved protein (some members contain a von Willebrand factor type A (vWA) domain) [Pseudomonas oleovorans]